MASTLTTTLRGFVAKPERVETVYFDASMLIAVITGEEAAMPLRSVLSKVDDKTIRLVASTALLLEVRRVGPGNDEARAGLRELLTDPDRTTLLDVDLELAQQAERYACDMGLKTWDAIHLATAVRGRAQVMFIRDGKFSSDTYVEGVYISEPWDLRPEDLLSLIPDGDETRRPFET